MTTLVLALFVGVSRLGERSECYFGVPVTGQSPRRGPEASCWGNCHHGGVQAGREWAVQHRQRKDTLWGSVHTPGGAEVVAC